MAPSLGEQLVEVSGENQRFPIAGVIQIISKNTPNKTIKVNAGIGVAQGKV